LSQGWRIEVFGFYLELKQSPLLFIFRNPPSPPSLVLSPPPKRQIREMVELYEENGVAKEDAEVILNTMSKYKTFFLKHMVGDRGNCEEEGEGVSLFMIPKATQMNLKKIWS
jgi:hypothetical protein